MKVYNVGANPISYTGNHRRVLGVAAQAVEPIATRGKEVMMTLAEDTITLMGKDDETLRYLYKHLPVGTERKLENFDGRRKISVFRGDGYMNKITQRLDSTPPLTFIRHMRNEGTSENPKLVTRFLSLRDPNDFERITIDILDEPKRQLFLRVVRDGFETHRALYDTWNDLRQNDIFFQKLAEKLTGKKF
jgi:hypothetical protein